jgi:hypothetical protein
MTDRAWGAEYRTTIVCIDSHENRIPQGRFYNPYLPEGVAFCGLTQFLMKMEDSLNQMDFPRSFTAVRSFAPMPEYPAESPDTVCQTGKLATFSIRILFRQNASWQGLITWMEGRREQSFRSVLELTFLIDSALSSSDNSDTEG